MLKMSGIANIVRTTSRSSHMDLNHSAQAKSRRPRFQRGSWRKIFAIARRWYMAWPLLPRGRTGGSHRRRKPFAIDANDTNSYFNINILTLALAPWPWSRTKYIPLATPWLCWSVPSQKARPDPARRNPCSKTLTFLPSIS